MIDDLLTNNNLIPPSIRGLSEGELLSLWEHGITMPPSERAELIISTVIGSVSETVSTGDRDRALMMVYENSFGKVVELADTCLSCGERFEYTIDLSVLQRNSVRTGKDYFTEQLGSWTAKCRLPFMVDLRVIIAQGREGVALAECCITALTMNGNPMPVSSIPDALLDMIESRIVNLDPAIEISLELICPACNYFQISIFDITHLLWQKIVTGAQMVASNVHSLAAAYGWSEEAILRMSSSRRQLYLSMAGME